MMLIADRTSFCGEWESNNTRKGLLTIMQPNLRDINVINQYASLVGFIDAEQSKNKG